MAELTPIEKLQPCLLERLRDDEPSNKEEIRSSRVVSLFRYKESVLRDLRWLLNARCPPPDVELGDYTEAAESVLNFGLPDFCGISTSSANVEELRRAIEITLRRFEPRIDRRSLQVRVVEEQSAVAPGTVAFEIRGQLWARPIPEPLYIRTRLDLETGQTEVV
jgi:type VI secretion system protein ImpF